MRIHNTHTLKDKHVPNHVLYVNTHTNKKIGWIPPVENQKKKKERKRKKGCLLGLNICTVMRKSHTILQNSIKIRQKHWLYKYEQNVGVQNKLVNECWQSNALRIILFFKGRHEYNGGEGKTQGSCFEKCPLVWSPTTQQRLFEKKWHMLTNKHTSNEDLFSLMSLSDHRKRSLSFLWNYYVCCVTAVAFVVSTHKNRKMKVFNGLSQLYLVKFQCGFKHNKQQTARCAAISLMGLIVFVKDSFLSQSFHLHLWPAKSFSVKYYLSFKKSKALSMPFKHSPKTFSKYISRIFKGYFKTLTWSRRWVALTAPPSSAMWAITGPKNCLGGYRADLHHKARDLKRTAFLTSRCHNSKINVRVCLFSNRDSDEMAP